MACRDCVQMLIRYLQHVRRHFLTRMNPIAMGLVAQLLKLKQEFMFVHNALRLTMNG